MWREIADIGTIYTKKRLRGYDKSKKKQFNSPALFLVIVFVLPEVQGKHSETEQWQIQNH